MPLGKAPPPFRPAVYTRAHTRTWLLTCSRSFICASNTHSRRPWILPFCLCDATSDLMQRPLAGGGGGCGSGRRARNSKILLQGPTSTAIIHARCPVAKLSSRRRASHLPAAASKKRVILLLMGIMHGRTRAACSRPNDTWKRTWKNFRPPHVCQSVC